MGARFYDPLFSTFLSPDPLSALSGGSPRMNRYSYVGYDPVNYVDPDGRFLVPALIAFGVASAYSTLKGLEDGHWDTADTIRIVALAAGTAAGIALPALITPASNSLTALISAATKTSLLAGSVHGFAQGALSWAFDGGGLGQTIASTIGSGLSGGASAAVAGLVHPTGLYSTSPADQIVHAGAVSGASIGTQLLMGSQQIDWGSVAVNVISALAQAYYREYETSTALYEMQVGARILTALMAQEDPEEAFLREFGGSPATPRSRPTLDPETEAVIQTKLRPEIQPIARDHLLQLREWGIDARIPDDSASSYRPRSRQAALYANRRPGFRVAPPGSSAHEVGAAYDLHIYTSQGDYIKWGSEFRYQLAGSAGKSLGLEWGGSWDPRPDYPHYQLDEWRSLPPWP